MDTDTDPGPAVPKLQRAACPLHDGREHLHVLAPGDAWLCVPYLASLDEGIGLAGRDALAALAAKWAAHAEADFTAAREQGGSTAHGLRGAGQAESDCARQLLELIGAPPGDLPGPGNMDEIAAMPGVTTVISTPQCAVVMDAGEVVTVVGWDGAGLRQYESVEEHQAAAAGWASGSGRPAPASIAGDLPPLPQRHPGGSLTPGHAARKAWEEHWGTAVQRGRGTPGYDERADEDAGWDAVAQAAIGAAGTPEAKLAACPAHGGAEHAQVRTYGNWMCVIGLRGLDGGWTELEAALREAGEGREVVSGVLGKIRATEILHAGGKLSAGDAMAEVSAAFEEFGAAVSEDGGTGTAAILAGPGTVAGQ